MKKRLMEMVREKRTLAQQIGQAGLSTRALIQVWEDRDKAFWRAVPEIYDRLSTAFLDRGEPELAAETALEAITLFPSPSTRALQNYGLALIRLGEVAPARQLIESREPIDPSDAESQGLKARIFKDLWQQSGDRSYLGEAYNIYLAAFRASGNKDAFTGVNAATLGRILGASEAGRVMETVTRLTEDKNSDPWEVATHAECLLVSGQTDQAAVRYRQALDLIGRRWGWIATMMRQARMIARELRLDWSELARAAHFPAIGIACGHLANPTPHNLFPDADGDRLLEQIKVWLKEHRVQHGYSSAARGADLLFQQALLEAGCESHIVLPCEPDRFEATSVIGGNDAKWRPLFRQVLEAASELIVAPQATDLVTQWRFTNHLTAGLAMARARELEFPLEAFAFWNGVIGQSPGGTAETVLVWRRLGLDPHVVTPGTFAVAPPRGYPDQPAKGLEASVCIAAVPNNTADPDAVLAAVDSLAAQAAQAGFHVRAWFDRLLVEAVLSDQVERFVAGLVEHPWKALRFGVTVVPAAPELSFTSQQFLRLTHLAEAVSAQGSVAGTWEAAAWWNLQRNHQLRMQYAGRRRLNGAIEETHLFQRK